MSNLFKNQTGFIHQGLVIAILIVGILGSVYLATNPEFHIFSPRAAENEGKEIRESFPPIVYIDSYVDENTNATILQLKIASSLEEPKPDENSPTSSPSGSIAKTQDKDTTNDMSGYYLQSENDTTESTPNTKPTPSPKPVYTKTYRAGDISHFNTNPNLDYTHEPMTINYQIQSTVPGSVKTIWVNFTNTEGKERNHFLDLPETLPKPSQDNYPSY